MMKMSTLLLLFLLAGLPANAENADTFGEGARAYAAFGCAAYAQVAARHDPLKIVDPNEPSRLFNLGVSEARKHAKAILSGQYNPSTDILDGFRSSLAGPSVDFIAGRLAEYAQSEALEELPKKEVTLEWTTESGEKARETYQSRNCRALR